MRPQPTRPAPLRDDAAPPTRIVGPAELLQAIPYLLGFHPQASLVLVGMADGLLVVTARLDLADVDTAGVVHETLVAMSRGGSSAVVAVIYDDRSADALDDVAVAASGPPRHIVAAVVEDAVTSVGALLLDVVWVAAGRWRSLDCVDESCCPTHGRPLPDDPSPFAAAATYAGMVALPDRAALERLLAPLPAQARAEPEAALRGWDDVAASAALDGAAGRFERSAVRALFAAARMSDKPGWAGPELDDAARFGSALRIVAVRDAVWTAIDDGRLNGRALWRELGRWLPEPYDASGLFLFGWAVWRSGDGALAGIAAQRALDSDAGYSAAGLLLEALARGVDPRRLPRLRRSA